MKTRRIGKGQNQTKRPENNPNFKKLMFLFNQTKNLKVWPSLSSDTYLVEKKKFAFDGRKQLKEKCLWMGAIPMKNLHTSSIVSFCIPDGECAYQVCFYHKDLLDLLSIYGNVRPPNIWKEEMQKALPPKFKDMVPDVLPNDWVAYVYLHDDIVKAKSEPLDENPVGLQKTIFQQFARYFDSNASHFSLGGFWPVSVSDSFSFILRFPLWTNIILTLCKCIRMFVCSFMNGLDTNTVLALLNEHIVKENIIIKLVVYICVQTFNCLRNIVTTGFQFTSIYSCVMDMLKTFFTGSVGVSAFLLKVAQVLCGVIVVPLDLALQNIASIGPTYLVAPLTVLRGSLQWFSNFDIKTFTVFFKGRKKMTLRDFVESYFKHSVFIGTFWLLVYLTPWSTFTMIVDALSLFPYIGSLVILQKMFVRIITLGHVDSVLDAFILILKIPTAAYHLFLILNLLNDIFQDIIVCYFWKKEEKGCCFKEFLDATKPS
jgi:hypothetical protein